MILLYSGLPLGWIMRTFVRGTTFRHLFAIILGVLIQAYMYREQIIHPFLMTTITYILMNVLPRNFQHKVVFVFVMTYMSCQHLYRMYTNWGGWDMDITTFTMLLTARLSSLGFCYKDGGLNDSELIKDQIQRKVVHMPSIMEVYSYTFFCSACLCGPFFEFSDYINFIEMKGNYAKVPSTVLASLSRFG
jgi:MBOAT, membrane-bound O-acyltransferase family